jgi:hypothetical protein
MVGQESEFASMTERSHNKENTVSQLDQDQITYAATANFARQSWQGIFLVGGIAALLALAGTLADIAITMIPGWETSTVPYTIQAWFTQFQTNPLLGLRNLDLLNVTIWLIETPMILALYGAHRRGSQAYAALASIVMLVGTVVLTTSNVALPMLELSKQYALASTDAQRLTIEAAGVALLARGTHGSMGAFAGFFLRSIGSLLMGLAMLKGRVFTRVTARVGIVGMALLSIYVIGSTFIPRSEAVMMALAMPGGLLMIAWNVMVARKLFQLRTAPGV